jgi:hypothetical protein
MVIERERAMWSEQPSCECPAGKGHGCTLPMWECDQRFEASKRRLASRDVESPAERALYAVDMATADLILAVVECQTTDDALQLSAFIQPLILKLEACESSARHRADQLSGASR